MALAGCGPLPSTDELDALDCDPRELELGEIRARQVACNDEVPSTGEGRKGDVLLQNADLSVVLRTPWESLTRPGHGGGTLVDAVVTGWRDRVLEFYPLVADGFFEADGVTFGVEDQMAWATFTGHGVPFPPLGGGTEEEVAVTWWLEPDRQVLGLEGAEGLWLRPGSGAVFLEAGFVQEGFAVLTDGHRVEEPQGALWLHDVSALIMAPVDQAGELAWPEGVRASGECSGEAVEVWLEERLQLRLGATFATRVPQDAVLRCVLAGADPGETVAPGPDLVLEPGEPGGILLRLGDERGEDLSALVRWDGGEHPLPSGGGEVPLPPGIWDLVVDAGPAHEPWRGRVEVPGEQVLVLRRAIDTTGWVLVEVGRDAWPSWTSGLTPEDDLALAAARGVDLVVQTPQDEVGVPVSEGWAARQVRGLGGSLAVSDVAGAVWSWSWSPNAKRAGHGAVAWQGHTPEDLLALAAGGLGSRFTMVDVAWVEAAGEPWTWDPRPDLLRLGSLDDLPVLQELLSQGVAIGVAGPLAWGRTDTSGLPSAAALQRDLVTGRSTATTGPLLTLDTVWEQLTTEGVLTGLTLALEARAAADVTAIELWVDGVLVAVEDVSPETTSHTLSWSGSVERYGVGVARGADWAVSAPIMRGP